MMLKRDLAALGLGTDSEHERDAEEYWRDLEMLRSCAAEVGAPHGCSSRPGRVCRNATEGPGITSGMIILAALDRMLGGRFKIVTIRTHTSDCFFIVS